MSKRLCKSMLLLLAAALSFATAVPEIRAADRSADRFRVQDQRTNYGLGYSEKVNGGSLSWGESYILDGYIKMYESTLDTEWLDKSVEHLDLIKDNAVDFDADGYADWPDPAFAHDHLRNGSFQYRGALPAASEAIANGSFETDANSDQVPDGWSREGSSAKVYRSTTAGDYYSGSAGVIIESDGTNTNRLSQSFAYVPGKTYRVEVFAGVETEKTQALIEVYHSSGQVIAFQRVFHVGFERYILNFTAPASGTLSIRLGLENYSGSGYKARFDQASIKLADDFPGEVVQNRFFELLDSGDSTMADNWSRWYLSDSSNIHVADDINEYHSGSKGLAVTTNNTSWEIAEQTMTYTPSQEYAVTYWARVTDARYGAMVELYNATDDLVIAYDTVYNTAWTQKRFNFTAPASSGKTLKIRLYQTNWDTAFTAFFDEVSVKPVQITYPAAWSSNVALSQAHLTNSGVANPVGDWGLELVHNGVDDPIVAQELINYKPNSDYQYSVVAKVTSGATGRIRVYDDTTDTTLGQTTFTNNSGFQTQTINFTTPAANHEVRIEIYMILGSNGQKLYAISARAAQYAWAQVNEARIGYAFLKFVEQIDDDPSLAAAYGTKADEYRDFVADELFRKYDDYWRQITGSDGSDNGTGVYVFPDGFSMEYFPSRSLPHNMYMAYARMLYLLYDLTEGVTAYAADRPYYLSRANDMSRLFLSKATEHRLDEEAYEWKYWEPLGAWDDGHYYTDVSDDISHAAIVMTGVLEAYRYGQVFSASDIRKFKRTFTDIMWNGSLSDPVLSYFLHRYPAYTVDKERTNEMINWVDFAVYDHEVWEIADVLCKEDLCTSVVAAGVAEWSRSKVVNSGFEYADLTDSTLPAQWGRWQATSSTAYLDSIDPAKEDRAVIVKTNGTLWQALEQKVLDYEPNTEYTVTFKGKTNGQVGGRVDVLDFTTSSLLNNEVFYDTSWSDHSFTFTTPASGHDIRIHLYQSDYTPIDGIVYYDEVRMLPALYNSHVPNGSFESVDRFDASLPAYWFRGGSSNVSNVRIDTSNRTSGSQSVKLSTLSGGAAQELLYQWYGYRPGATYNLTVKGKTNGSLAGGRVKVVDASTNTVLEDVSITGTSWSTYTASFDAPMNHDHQLKVVITHDQPATAGGDLWIDDLGITLD